MRDLLDEMLRDQARQKATERIVTHEGADYAHAAACVAAMPDHIIEAVVEALPKGKHRLPNGWSATKDTVGYDLFDERGRLGGWAETLEAAEASPLPRPRSPTTNGEDIP